MRIFIGATMLEMYVGRAWLTVLLPRYWGRRATLVRLGWEKS